MGGIQHPFGMSIGSFIMIMTCLYSLALIFPAELQLSRRSVWTIMNWIGFSTVQCAVAWFSIAWAVKRSYNSRITFQTIGDAGILAPHFAIMSIYGILTVLILVRFGVLYTQVDGDYRVNVLETNAPRDAPITQSEIDLREALTLQTITSAFAVASIAAFLYGLLATTIMLPKRVIGMTEITTISQDVESKPSHKHHNHKHKHKSSSHKKGHKKHTHETDSDSDASSP